jgi:hypothetical protein
MPEQSFEAWHYYVPCIGNAYGAKQYPLRLLAACIHGQLDDQKHSHACKHTFSCLRQLESFFFVKSITIDIATLAQLTRKI